MRFKDQFDSFVRWFGGEIVEDLLPQVGDLPKNADYFLFDRAVVAELKCLEEDYFGAAHIAKKITHLTNGWIRQGLLSRERIVNGRFSTDQLPKTCALQMIDLFAKPMREAAADANKQLKATKAYFLTPEAKGLLILANVGNFSLNPDISMHILGRLFRKRFSAIESYVFLVPWIESEVPGVDKSTRIWVSGPTRSVRSGVPSKLMDHLSSAWIQFLQKDTTDSIEVIQAQDEQLLLKTEFRRRRAP